jgi:hypothetical protein
LRIFVIFGVYLKKFGYNVEGTEFNVSIYVSAAVNIGHADLLYSLRDTSELATEGNLDVCDKAELV